MPQLNQIFQDIACEVSGHPELSIDSIHTDSRQIRPGDLFVAVAGTQVNGHDFIGAAIEAGAAAVAAEYFPEHPLINNVVRIQIPDTARVLGRIAASYYGQPAKSLTLVGVTGTNGKTTVATLLYKLFTQLGHMCGLISTVQNRVGQETVPSTHTTPDPIALHGLLARMKEAGCRFVFMECSSHAIHQHRIAGLSFAGGVFTNITHDHLDYHKTFAEYIRVKKSFFDGLSPAAFAITNIDDKRGDIMVQNTSARIRRYSLRSMADIKGKMLSNDLTGLIMEVNGTEVHFRLIGEFNAYNLLSVYGVAVELGISHSEALLGMSVITGAEGRFDYMISARGVIGVVDYAHTPDAVENVLATLKKLKTQGNRIATVIGCGGDRDKTKRPLMAVSAAEYSDALWLTSDNPRTEDPLAILSDMHEGLGAGARRRTRTEPDRAKAITAAVAWAAPGDIVLVAGKGHETYQEIQKIKYPFSDKEVLLHAFQQTSGT